MEMKRSGSGEVSRLRNTSDTNAIPLHRFISFCFSESANLLCGRGPFCTPPSRKTWTPIVLVQCSTMCTTRSSSGTFFWTNLMTWAKQTQSHNLMNFVEKILFSFKEGSISVLSASTGQGREFGLTRPFQSPTGWSCATLVPPATKSQIEFFSVCATPQSLRAFRRT